jgi:hypothetical protein
MCSGIREADRPEAARIRAEAARIRAEAARIRAEAARIRGGPFSETGRGYRAREALRCSATLVSRRPL